MKDSTRSLLNFVLFFDLRLHTSEPLTMSTWVLDQVFSEPFTVYSPKEFPGMTGNENLYIIFLYTWITLDNIWMDGTI